MNAVIEALQCLVVEADYADQYVGTLQGIRQNVTKMIEDFDKTISLISPKTDRAKLLQTQRDDLVTYLQGFEKAFKKDPLAQRKGF